MKTSPTMVASSLPPAVSVGTRIHPLSNSWNRLALATMGAAVLATGSAQAAVRTYDGEGNNNNLIDAVNWVGDVAPVAGDSLIFAGATGTSPTTNGFAANTLFTGIGFNATATSFIVGSVSSPVINLGGNITDDSLFSQTINNPLALTASRSVGVSSKFGALTLGGVVSETGGTGFGLTKTGSGLLTLGNAANTFTGPVVINGGTLAIAADSTGAANPLGSGAAGASLTINGGALRSTATAQLSTNRSVLLGSSTAGTGGTIDVAAGTLTYNGVMANNGAANSLTKTNVGILDLGGVNTYTGTTNVNLGTLRLNFNTLAGTTTNIVNSGSRLVLGGASTALGSVSYTANVLAPQATAGATLNMTSKNNAASSQTFNGVTLNGGYNTISTTQTGTGTNLLTLGTISRTVPTAANTGYTAGNGSVVNFSFAGALANGVNAINVTGVSTNGGAAVQNTNGILGGWATYQAGPAIPIADYAALDANNNVVAYTGYTAQAAGAIASSAPTNYQVQTAAAVALSTADAATTDVNTLSLSPAATGVTTTTVGTAGASSTGILRVGASGGFLVGSTTGTLIVGDVANNGTLTAGGADNTAGELSFVNSNTTASATGVTVNSKITDNGTGVVSVTYGGTQGSGGNIANVFGANTYSGGTTITTARVTASNASAFGTGSVTVNNGAQAFLSVTGTYANNFNIAGGGTNIAVNNAGYFDSPGALRVSVNNTTLTGTITLLNDASINLRNSTGVVISGQITGDYDLFLTSNGASGGDVTLSNTSNNWSGNLVIDQKRVILGNSEVISNGAGKGNVVFSNNANSILDLNGKNETINGLISYSTPQGFVQNNALATTSILTLGDGDASATFVGTIRDNSGTGGTIGIVKIGSGTQFLNTASTYTGGTTVKAGILFRGANNNPFGTGGITLGDTTGSASATLRFSNQASGYTATNAITVASGSSGAKTLDVVGSGQNFNFANAITLNDTLNVNTYATNTNSITLSGAISGSAGLNVSARGGAITVNGATNSYAGGTTLAAGTLTVAAGGRLGSGNVSLTDAAGVVLTLASTVSFGDSAILTFGNSDVINLNFSGALASTDFLGGIVDSTTSLSIGPGTFTAADLNTFFGTTTFAGTGTLTVPEPSTWTMLAGSLGMAMSLQRFRRRRA